MLCLLLTRYTQHKKHFSIVEKIIVSCSWLTLPPAPSLTIQLEQLTGWSNLGQLAIAPRPHYSMEKFMLDPNQQSLPCLSVHSHPVNVVFFSSEIPALEDTALPQVEIPVLLHSPPEKHLDTKIYSQTDISAVLSTHIWWAECICSFINLHWHNSGLGIKCSQQSISCTH